MAVIEPDVETTDEVETTEEIELTDLEKDELELAKIFEKEEASVEDDFEPEADNTPPADSEEPDDDADDNIEPKEDEPTGTGQTGDTADPEQPQTGQSLEERFTALEQDYKSNKGRLENLGRENAELRNKLSQYDKFSSLLSQSPALGRIFSEAVYENKLPDMNQHANTDIDYSDYDPSDPQSMMKFIDERAKQIIEQREKQTIQAQETASRQKIRNSFIANSDANVKTLLSKGIAEKDISVATAKFIQDIALKLPEMAYNHANFEKLLKTETQKAFEEGKKEALKKVTAQTGKPKTLSGVQNSRTSKSDTDYSKMSEKQLTMKFKNTLETDPEFPKIQAALEAKIEGEDDELFKEISPGKKRAG